MRLTIRCAALSAVTALLATASLTGCGEATSATSAGPAAENSCVDPGILGFRQLDYADQTEGDPVSFVERRQVPVVVSGAVTDVLEGPSLEREGEAGGPDGEPYVVIKIAVDDELRVADRSMLHDGSAYVLADRGPFDTETGEPFPLASWNKALPAGTKVVAFLDAARPDLRESFEGAWEETPPLAGVRGGLITESCGHLDNFISGASGPGWDYKSVDELRDALARRG